MEIDIGLLFLQHEVVQAYSLKFRTPQMPHAIATRMAHIWNHANRLEQQ